MTDGARNDGPEAPAEAPLKEQVLDQMGGWQGLVYSALPVAAFVPANSLWGLRGGVIAALVVAAIVLVIRLATRSSVQPAVSGFLGVGVCALIALLVGGNGKGFFLYGIVMQAVLAVVFAVSILVRWPLVGVLWHLFDERSKAASQDWRGDRRRFRVFAWLTVLWIAMFATRFAVQLALYLGDDVGWLGVARIAMGWPMFAVGLLITYLVARKLSHADDR